MLIYILLIAIIVLSLITGLVTTIIEQKDLIAQRTMVFKAIKDEKEKSAAQEIVSNPVIKHTESQEMLELTREIELLDLTREIEVLDFDNNDNVMKKYKDIEVL